MEQDEFPIRAYGRTELAVCYFPHLNSQAAYRKLQQWIDHYPHLRERLEATSSKAGSHFLQSPLPDVHAGAGADDCGSHRGALSAPRGSVISSPFGGS